MYIRRLSHKQVLRKNVDAPCVSQRVRRTGMLASRACYGNLRNISDLLIYPRKSKAVGREPDGFHCFMLLWNYFWISSTHCW